MTDVVASIRELLYNHDCVIIPTFGGFIGNYRPAGIDNSSHTFTPPVKAISFNRNLSNNDGLLIGKISADTGTGYGDSKKIIERFVDDLRNKLASGKRVTFDKIGYFRNNAEGNVQFEPDPDSNFLLDSYGLSSFRRDPVQDFTVAPGLSVRKKGKVGSGYALRKMAWRAAIAVPFIAAMIYVPLKTDLFRSKAGLNPLTASEFEDNRKMLSETGTPELTKANEAETITPKQEIQQSETDIEAKIVPVEEGGSFYVVAGSFKDQNNAFRLSAQVETKGYSPEILKSPNGFFRVAIVTADSYRNAVTERNNTRKDYPDTWIWKED